MNESVYEWREGVCECERERERETEWQKGNKTYMCNVCTSIIGIAVLCERLKRRYT